MSDKRPFEQEEPGYYTRLGSRERRAYAPLEPVGTDGVVGSMSQRWREWRAMGAPRRVVQWLRQGVPLRWRGGAPQQAVQINPVQDRRVEGEMEKLLETGAFIPQGCRIVSPTFVIPKKDGSMRLIHDLRQVNARLAAPKFTLHGVREAAEVVRQSNFLVSLDLKKGYQQVAVAKEARPYLGRCMEAKQLRPRSCHSAFR